jgi:predicted RNase H-like HicB family nuclease
MKDYHVNVLYSDEDEGYIVDIPDLPHCAAFGETPEQVLAEVLKAKSAWIDAANGKGKPIPPPTFKPLIPGVESSSMSPHIHRQRSVPKLF